MVSNGLNVFWRWLRWPWLLIFCCVSMILLLVGAFLLPQLPGQFNDDSAAATRWLLSTSAEHGTIGRLLLSLGLFNVVQGSLLRLFLALLGLLLLIHLADLVEMILWFRQLPTRLAPARPVDEARLEPLPIPSSHTLYRSRWIAPALPDALYQRLSAHLESTPTPLKRVMLQTDEVVLSSPSPLSGEGHHQLLLARDQSALYFRLLLALGLVISVVVLWFTITVGWTVSPPPLAPGETFRYPPRDLELRYQVMESMGDLPLSEEAKTPTLLQVRIGRESQSTSAEEPSSTRLGTVDVQVEPGPPGVLIQSSTAEAILAVPGQQGRSSSIGLIFPVSGSEESVVLPEAQVGIRIVRLATTASASSNFMVEIFQREENQPIQRMRLLRDQIQSIPLENPDNPDLAVLLIPSPGLNVSVRYMPGTWFFWLGSLLILIGVIGFGFRAVPTFVSIQIESWPKEQSVVIVQSNQKAGLEGMRGLMN